MITYMHLESLESDLGIPLNRLFAVSNSITKHYKRVTVPRRNGAPRELLCPDAPLKEIQRRILTVLLPEIPISPYATAYRPGLSTLSAAEPHIGREMLLRLDIRGFFDSIKYIQVKERVFSADRFSEKCRVLLSMLCYCRDKLPQGAPTSPAISNIIMRENDLTIGAFCRDRGIRYTRYCDDMTFSGSFDKGELISFVDGVLRRDGFILNREKTRFSTSGKRQSVLGIVTNTRAAVPKEYKKRIRAELYFIKKYGVCSHIERAGLDESPSEYLANLLGRTSYVLHIEPNNKEFADYQKELLHLLKDN